MATTRRRIAVGVVYYKRESQMTDLSRETAERPVPSPEMSAVARPNMGSQAALFETLLTVRAIDRYEAHLLKQGMGWIHIPSEGHEAFAVSSGSSRHRWSSRRSWLRSPTPNRCGWSPMGTYAQRTMIRHFADAERFA